MTLKNLLDEDSISISQVQDSSNGYTIVKYTSKKGVPYHAIIEDTEWTSGLTSNRKKEVDEYYKGKELPNPFFPESKKNKKLLLITI